MSKIKLKTKKTNFKLKNVINIFRNKKNQNIFSALLILKSSYLIISFISFFFNWKTDDNIVSNNDFIDVISNNNIENAIGGLGAYISNLLIKDSFGIFAFIIPFALLILAGNIFGFKKLRFKKLIFKLIIALVLFPVILCHFTSLTIYSGAVGIYINELLNTVLGKIGNTLLLLTIIIFYIASYINLTDLYSKFKNLIKKKKQDIKDLNTKTQNDQLLEDDSQTYNKDNEINNSRPVLINNNIETDDNLNKLDENKLEPKTANLGIEINEIKDEETLSTNDIEKKLEELGDYDPTLELSNYRIPSIEILKNYGNGKIEIDKSDLEEKKDKIVETLGHYKIGITSISATVGPTITLYEIVPNAGIRISKIKNLEDDIALSLAAEGIRIIAPIPGKGTVGIEVPNKNKTTVSMLEVLKSEKFQDNKMELPIAFGKTISNETFVVDLTKMPHLLMAGATGQGKSVGLNVILTSLLYKKHPAEIKFVLVDPKKVELTLFNKIEKHFLAKLPDSEEAIITDTKKVINTINSLCIEMDERYELCKKAQCRNIKEYNTKFISRKLNPNKGHRFLPYIVLVIDEFADLIMTAGKEIETPIARLAQLARAIGIHLIIATQRPSVNVITGIIKANFPARVAFRVTSSTDSRTILDSKGADQLIGMGDMLISTGSDLTRLQCAFIDTPEVEKLCEEIGSQNSYSQAHILPEFSSENESSSVSSNLEEKDDLFNEAARIVVQHQSGSTSLIQRKLRLGYNRAGRIIDQLESAKIVGPPEGSKARQVLIKTELELEELLNSI
tara:strand:+ start:2012 stop:4378 length:2367 start_codon:yes stop_codon:yes gene_type:complete